MNFTWQQMRALLAVAGVALGLAIVSYLVLSPSMRMIADDFCFTYEIQKFGVWDNFIKQYNTWAGEYIDPLLKGVLYRTLGLSAHPLMPIILYGIWWAGSVAVFTQVARVLGWQKPLWLGSLVGTLYTFMLFSTMPTRSVIYWLSATVSYVTPIVAFTALFAFWIAMTFTTTRLAYKAIFIGMVMFLLGGTTFLFTLLAMSLWGLLFLLAWWQMPTPYRRSSLVLSGGAIVGTLVSLGINLSAPGNWRRLETATGGSDGGLLETVTLAINSAVGFWVNPFSLVNIALLVAMSAGLVCAWYALRLANPQDNTGMIALIRRRTWVLIGAIVVWGCGYTLLSVALPAFGAGDVSLRVLVYARAAQMLVAVVVGVVLGIRYAHLVRTPTLAHLVAGVFVLGSLGLAGYRLIDNAQLLPAYQAWAQEWDARHSALQALAREDAQSVSVAVFQHPLPKFLGPSTDDILTDWTRMCLERFYGIPSLTAVDSLPDGQAAARLE